MVSAFVAVAAAAATRTGVFHRLYLRGNPAPGILRLGVIVAMAWIAFVLWRYADPSVTGIHVVSYLIMGYAIVKLVGQFAASWFGARIRVDAIERRNVPAALVIAAFTVATGLIFGGSLWGEADPVGDDECRPNGLRLRRPLGMAARSAHLRRTGLPRERTRTLRRPRRGRYPRRPHR